MSNEELVAVIQAGEDRMGELWEQVAGLVKWKASRIMTVLQDGSGRGVEFDDLYQSGYPALVAAVDTYDSAAGAAFSTWFMYHLKNAFAEVTGYRTKKGRNEPLDNAASLDKTVDDEADGTPFSEFVPDPKATATMLGVEEMLWRDQLHEAVEAVMEDLPQQYSEMLRMRYLQGMTLAAVGDLKGVTAERIRHIENKALREIRKARYACHLRPFYDFDFYCGTGLGAFQHSGMSIQERYLILEEDRKEREARRRQEREEQERHRQKQREKELAESHERYERWLADYLQSLSPEARAELDRRLATVRGT